VSVLRRWRERCVLIAVLLASACSPASSEEQAPGPVRMLGEWRPLFQGIEHVELRATRALWAIAESARALPKEGELATLAAAVRAKARAVAEAALADMAKSPGGDPAAFFRALYATMACREDALLAEKARTVLAGGAAGSPVLQLGRTLAAALLAPASDVDRKVLSELVAKRGAEVRGDDLVALTALACRRAGGEAWRAFRAEARDLLGRQPLDGSVVVLVNRLDRPGIQLAAAR